MENGPIWPSESSWARMSRSVNFPAIRFSAAFWASSLSVSSSNRSRSVWMSPIPRSRDTKRVGSNRSSSSMCSPVPMNTIGAPLTATAESAPPPFAEPSSFVRTTPVRPTALWNASALRPAAWPIAASRTRSVSSGWRTSRIRPSSAIRSGSMPLRPAVSTMTARCGGNFATASRTITSARDSARFA